jgi:hypothetical protein
MQITLPSDALTLSRGPFALTTRPSSFDIGLAPVRYWLGRDQVPAVRQGVTAMAAWLGGSVAEQARG